MPLDKYPFSERYGWVQDKYGLSWQLILTNPEGEERPPIIPSLMFVGDVCGKAEEATDFYLSVFKDSKRGALPVTLPEWSPTRKEPSCSLTSCLKISGLPPWTAPTCMTSPLTRPSR